MDIKNVKDFSEKGKIKRTVVMSNKGDIVKINTVENAETKKEVKKIVDIYDMSRKEQEHLLKENKVKFTRKDNEASLVKKILGMKK